MSGVSGKQVMVSKVDVEGLRHPLERTLSEALGNLAPALLATYAVTDTAPVRRRLLAAGERLGPGRAPLVASALEALCKAAGLELVTEPRESAGQGLENLAGEAHTSDPGHWRSAIPDVARGIEVATNPGIGGNASQGDSGHDAGARGKAAAIRPESGPGPANPTHPTNPTHPAGVIHAIEVIAMRDVEGAARYACRDPAMLVVPSRIVPLLDAASARWALAVELGHVLAHGGTDAFSAIGNAAEHIVRLEVVAPDVREIAALLVVARQITADRIAATLCDHEAAARLDVVMLTGLTSSSISWEADVHVELCREAIEKTLRGEAATSRTVPFGMALRVAAREGIEAREGRFGEIAPFLQDIDPSLFHEAALASGVLVAAADDELDDAEIASLERTFGPMLGDIRPMLDLEVARKHLRAALPVLSALGPAAHRSLALLVLHAIADAGDLHPRELAMLDGIGDAMGAPLVRSIGTAAARRLPGRALASANAFVAVPSPFAAAPGSSASSATSTVSGTSLTSATSATSAASAASAASGESGASAASGASGASGASLPSGASGASAAGSEGAGVRGGGIVPTVEGEAAIDAFLQGFRSRGGGETTLRQLLILLGARARNPSLLSRIEDAIRRAGLRGSGELGLVDIDEPLVLVARVARTIVDDEPAAAEVGLAAGGGAMASPAQGPIALILHALERLRDGLISGDGRSPSVRVHQSRVGRLFDLHALEPLAVGRSERVLARLLRGDRVLLVDTSEAGQSDAGRSVSRELVELDREHRARIDETGARDLHVGHAFVCGNIGGYLVRAPLILVPAELVRDDRGARGFSLRQREGEAPFVNPALLRVLFARKGFALPDSLLEELDELAADKGADAVIGALDRVGLRIKTGVGPLSPLTDRREQVASWSADRLELETCAALALFPVSSSAILQDLDGLAAEIAKEPSRAAELLGTALEMFPATIRAELAPTGQHQLSPMGAPDVAMGEPNVALPGGQDAARGAARGISEPRRPPSTTDGMRLEALREQGRAGQGGQASAGQGGSNSVGQGKQIPVAGRHGTAPIGGPDVRASSAETGRADERGPAWAVQPSEQASPEGRVPSGGVIPVLPSDPTQRAVIERARTERVLVVDGPPGTGKSQVIVSLVADALSRGERVAVVSEKRAALDVVAQRLQQVGLDDAVVLVHDVNDDRRATYRKVADRLDRETTREADHAGIGRATRDILEATSILDTRAKALSTTLPAGTGAPLTLGNLHALVTSIEVHPAFATLSVPTLAQVENGALPRLIAGVIALRAFLDLYVPTSIWAAPRTSLAHCTPDQLASYAAGIDSAERAAIAFDAAWVATGGASLDAIIAARGAIQAARATRDLRSTLVAQQVFSAALSRVIREPGFAAKISSAEMTWRDSTAAIRRFPGRMAFDPGVKFEEHLQQLRRWTTKWPRFLSVSWWEAERAVRAALKTSWPERASATLDEATLDEIQAAIAASRAWEVAEECLEDLGPQAMVEPTIEATGEALLKAASTTRSAAALVSARTLLQAASAWPDPPSTEAIAAWDRWLDTLTGAVAAADARRAAIAPVRVMFPWLSLDATSTQLATLRAVWARDVQRVTEADRLLASATALHRDAAALILGIAAEIARVCPPESRVHEPAGQAGTRAASPRVSEPTGLRVPEPIGLRVPEPTGLRVPEPPGLRVPEPTTSAWEVGITRAWALARIAEIERISPDVRSLDVPSILGDELTVRATLSEAITRATELERGRILAVTDLAVSGRRRARPAGRDEMLHECRKQRRMMPLRVFVRRFSSSGLLEAAPVWLLSPETMTVLFPRHALFDRVIFDEASQCTVENGLPVLLRGARAVIVGDEKQMPPSSFFSAAPRSPGEAGEGEQNDDAGSSSNAGATSAASTLVDVPNAASRGGNAPAHETHPDPSARPSAYDPLASESLLTLARSRSPHAGLTWHYRCHREELIAFSNHAFYEGNLLTIPAAAGPEAPSALRWVAVEGGRLERGRNDPEARVVVDVIAELLGRSPRPSLGVVTLNVQQRQAVLDEIDARRGVDEVFAGRWAEASSVARLDERPFVKNLENVQGDERDVIVMSPGHAPVERRRSSPSAPVELYVPARFGPIAQRGGERRLNVAISRARSELIVVASFVPSMLSVARSIHDGPRLFQQFLAYAFHLSRGERAQARRVLDLAHGVASTSTLGASVGALGASVGALGASVGALGAPPGMSGSTMAASAAQAGPRMSSSRIPLAAQIAEALRAAGRACELDVGTSALRVPLAIVDPIDPTRHVTAVLTDEGDEVMSSFERHVHRPSALRARGWNVERVTSREWARDRDAVLRRLVRSSVSTA